jgi:hypothetical protein
MTYLRIGLIDEITLGVDSVSSGEKSSVFEFSPD